MTLIEFFDKTAIENVCACLVRKPERVILLGDKMKILQRHAEIYRQIFAGRGQVIEFIPRTINKNDMQCIIEAMSQIVDEYENCVFDLTGGEDLYLAAIGIVSERNRNKHIQMHRFNLRNGTIVDCDRDGITIQCDMHPSVSVEENIRIYGGSLVRREDRPSGTRSWDMNGDFCSDILRMWEVCRQNVRLWNTQIAIFETADKIPSPASDDRTLKLPMAELSGMLKRYGAKFVWLSGVIDPLYDAGLITAYDTTGECLSITFKNPQVKACLTKAGQVLEMLVYLVAREVVDPKSSPAEIPVYSDVMTGVVIDWDGTVHPENRPDTENEIDVMMMHGVVPVFVSCKNGFIEIEELYKLNSVADHFGGAYAKKVIVATALPDAGYFVDYIRQRAADMNIRLVENLQDMTMFEMQRVIRSFWCN